MTVSKKLILRDEVAGLGKRGDVVEVSPGYARNFLIPRGLGFPATEGALAQADAMRKNRLIKDTKDREAAEEIAKRLVSTSINIVARAGDGGKLFGSVTEQQIIDAIESQTKVKLRRKDLDLDEHIKEVGDHTAKVRLHSDVQFPINISVVAS